MDGLKTRGAFALVCLLAVVGLTEPAGAQVTAFANRTDWAASAAPLGSILCEDIENDAPANYPTPFTTANGWTFTAQTVPLTISVFNSGSINGSKQVHFRDFTAGVRVTPQCSPTAAFGFDFRTVGESWTVTIGAQSFTLPSNTNGFFGVTSAAPITDFILTGAAGPQGGLALDNLCCASAATPAIVGTALGTAAPPASLGGITLVPFALDDGDGIYRPGVGADVSVIPAPVGSLTLSSPHNHRRVGASWPSWSHGYSGDVYYSLGATSTTITLPPDTRAFAFYIAPEAGNATISAMTSDGATVAQSVTEASGFGFHSTGDATISTITVSSSVAYAIGEFLVAIPPAQLIVSSGNCLGGCCWEFQIGQYAGITGEITQVQMQVTTPGATITSASPGCGAGPNPTVTSQSATWQIPAGLPATYPDYIPYCTVRVCFNSLSSPTVNLVFTGRSASTVGNPPTLQRTQEVFDPSCAGLSPYPTGCNRLYTTDADFELGTQLSLNHDAPNSDQLQISRPARPLPYIAVACSSRGTIVRIDVNSGTVLGEYLTAPTAPGGAVLKRNPSRTTVDLYGNVWTGNRDEGRPGAPGFDVLGSVVRIGLVLCGRRYDRTGNGTAGSPYVFTPNPNGQYVRDWKYCTGIDRDGDGAIKTSRGIGNLLPWVDAGDGVGGGISGLTALGGPALVADAEDELIQIFQRTSGGHIRHVSIDKNNDVWVGGWRNAAGVYSNYFDKLSAIDGSILTAAVAPSGPGFPITGGGGYGGLINCAGMLFSTSPIESGVMCYDTASITPTQGFHGLQNPYGMGIDTNGFIWVSKYTGPPGVVWKLNPTCPTTIAAGPFATGLTPFDHDTATGLAVSPADNDVWVANRGSATVGRVNNAGSLQGVISVGASPTGVAVDTNGKVWVTNLYGNNAMRINPAIGTTGAVDLTVPLGAYAMGTQAPPSVSPTALIPANPYNYSDMTGIVALNATAGQGSWHLIQDSETPGQCWGKITWNTEAQGNTPAGTSIVVEARAADSVGGLGSQSFITLTSGVPFNLTGRYLEVRVTLKGIPGPPCGEIPLSPVLSDLRIECCCAEVRTERVLCQVAGNPPGLTGNYTMNLCIRNFSGVPAHWVLIPGANSPNYFWLNPPLPGDGSVERCIPLTISPPAGAENYCFQFTLFNDELEDCCRGEVCVDLPECDCVQFPTCDILCGGPDFVSLDPYFNFSVQNLGIAPGIGHVFILPHPPTAPWSAFPSYLPLNVAQYATSPVQAVKVNGAAPGDTVCFRITIHRPDLEICCDEVKCGVVPNCRDGGPTYTLCDTNCDSHVTVADIGPFVLALTDPAAYVAAYPDCNMQETADVNQDGFVTLADIGPFVLSLTGQ